MLFFVKQSSSIFDVQRAHPMKIHFEPQSTFVVVRERHIRAVVEELKPRGFDGSLVVTQFWRDSPVQITLRAEGIQPVASRMEINDYYGADGEQHLRKTLTHLFEVALKEWDETHPHPADSVG
jgi:hypothetical protein